MQCLLHGVDIYILYDLNTKLNICIALWCHYISRSITDCRYSDMKAMIECALGAYGRIQSGECAQEDSEVERLLNPISRLLVDSRRFSVAEHTLRKQEEFYYSKYLAVFSQLFSQNYLRERLCDMKDIT